MLERPSGRAPQLPPLRVVIIDDQAAIRTALRNLLVGQRDILIVGEAADGEEGLKVVHAEQPDMILLDLEMPRLDGFAFLRLQMAKRPTPVVVVSSHATRESVFRALELGALDFVKKPTRIRDVSDLQPIQEDLLRKLRLCRTLGLSQLTERTRAHAASQSNPNLTPYRPESAQSSTDLLATMRASQQRPQLPKRLLCIGASTGGPPAIATVLSGLHPMLPVSILVTQHMPDSFSAAFVERLTRTTPWPVREANPDVPISPGEVVVASGTHSLRVYRDGPLLRVQAPHLSHSQQSTQATQLSPIVPSIDHMLESAAQAMGSDVIAVILTGMSGDGVQGARAVHACGGRILAESPSTAVLSGMPDDVIASGVVSEVVPLRRMADVLTQLLLAPTSHSS